MRDGAIARIEFDSGDVLGARRWNRNNEIAIDISALGGDFVARRLDDQIRLAERPTFGPRGKFWKVGGIAFGNARSVPVGESLNLFLGKETFAFVMAVRRIGQPRGHDAFGGQFGDLLRTLGNVVVIEQRERRALAGAMAGRAIFENDRRDIARKGRRGGANGRG